MVLRKSVDYSRLKKVTISYYIKKYGLNQKCFIYETSENDFETVKLYEGKLAFVPLKLRSGTVRHTGFSEGYLLFRYEKVGRINDV